MNLTDPNTSVLAINGGSSTIRFAIYRVGSPMVRTLGGKLDRVGLGGSRLSYDNLPQGKAGSCRVPAATHADAGKFLLNWLENQPAFSSVCAVGHRVVHGMSHSEPERVTPGLLSELARIIPYDPEHLPREIELIGAFQGRHPRVPQVACFDTAFHRTMPRVARLLPIPRRYAAKGIVHYGFHGISYQFLMEELTRAAGASAARGRVILAHLGSGSSLAAVKKGGCIDTSMGFTPAGGLVMGTRSGDLDPGVAYFLARTERMTAAQFQTMVNTDSGLRGISGTSSDMRSLLARSPADPRAADAVNVFCYQASKWVGAYAAALGGLDTLVFAGGIGENAPQIREHICSGLGFLGVRVHKGRNQGNSSVISTDHSAVAVRVIHTNEELMIARSVMRVLGPGRRVSP